MPQLKGKAGIRAYLLARIGQKVHNSELFEASGRQSEYTRRIRELRTEEGWEIQSYRDADDLRPDEYRLASPPPENPPPRFTRRISQRTRALVLQRNGMTCQICGAGPGDVVMGKRVQLVVDHIDPKLAGGSEELTNLRVLCDVCNSGIQENNPMPLSTRQVLSAVRRASREGQLAVLRWLKQRFEPEDVGHAEGEEV